MLIHHLSWIQTGSGDCSDHLAWKRTGSGDYGDLGMRNKNTDIWVDVNLLTNVTSTSCFTGRLT